VKTIRIKQLLILCSLLLIFTGKSFASSNYCSGALLDMAAGDRRSPVVGAELVAEWNNLAIEWIRLSERGPTISGRFAAYVNISMYDAWAAFEQQARGVFTDSTATHSENDQDAAISCAAYKVVNAIGESILNQKHLEIGAGEDANKRLAILRNRSLQLLHDSTDNQTTDTVMTRASRLADSVASKVIAHAMSDGANQENDYADTSAYSVTPWVVPVPATDDGISDYDFLGTGYSFAGFDPTVAQGVNGGVETVHPMVLDGRLRLTRSWQSLTQLGVFPPADDGGQQIPLTPHWGQVSTLVLASGDQMRPESVLRPYDQNGNLNDQWVRESRQLIEFSAAMQDGVDASAIQRARSEYWELGDATEYPPGWWLQRATDLALQRNLTQRETIKLLLAVSVATFEAGIASWDIKFHFDTVRPITAVNELFYGSEVYDWRGSQIAKTDDRDHWRPYQLRRNLTPPFPDVPSGHSSFSSAAAVVMLQLLQTNFFGYSTESFTSRFDLTDGFDGNDKNDNEETSLYWEYLSRSAEEAGLSRLYGGIHMMDGNLLGLKLGTQLGHMTVEYIDALFGDQPRQASELVFGKGTADAELVTPDGTCGAAEVYGFHGNDFLKSNLNCDGTVNLFGGEGLDTYRIEGVGDIWIRDYEIGERIVIGFSRLTGNRDRTGEGSWVDGHRVSAVIESAYGATSTLLIIDGNDAVRLEGKWSLPELTLNIGTRLEAEAEGCSYRDAASNKGWGWNPITLESCAPAH